MKISIMTDMRKEEEITYIKANSSWSHICTLLKQLCTEVVEVYILRSRKSKHTEMSNIIQILNTR